MACDDGQSTVLVIASHTCSEVLNPDYRINIFPAYPPPLGTHLKFQRDSFPPLWQSRL